MLVGLVPATVGTDMGVVVLMARDKARGGILAGELHVEAHPAHAPAKPAGKGEAVLIGDPQLAQLGDKPCAGATEIHERGDRHVATDTAETVEMKDLHRDASVARTGPAGNDRKRGGAHPHATVSSIHLRNASVFRRAARSLSFIRYPNWE